MLLIEKYNAEQFAAWFAESFPLRYDHRKRHMAFIGANIYPSLPIVAELARVYKALPPEAQQNFRTGLVQAADRIRHDMLPVMDEVFSLAKQIDLTEMAPRIRNVLGTSAFNAQDYRAKESKAIALDALQILGPDLYEGYNVERMPSPRPVDPRQSRRRSKGPAHGVV